METPYFSKMPFLSIQGVHISGRFRGFGLWNVCAGSMLVIVVSQNLRWRTPTLESLYWIARPHRACTSTSLLWTASGPWAEIWLVRTEGRSYDQRWRGTKNLFILFDRERFGSFRSAHFFGKISWKISIVILRSPWTNRSLTADPLKTCQDGRSGFTFGRWQRCGSWWVVFDGTGQRLGGVTNSM